MYLKHFYDGKKYKQIFFEHVNIKFQYNQFIFYFC